MFGFGRKKRVSSRGTAQTFVEATGGGWQGPTGVIFGDGGNNADFVKQTLERAHAHALEQQIPVGQEFEFTITDIPVGISSPHEIVFGLMTQAKSFGLETGVVADEKVMFTRLN